MKFTVTKGELNRALKRVAGAVQSNSPIPALSTVLLLAEGNKLKVTGCNCELQISTEIDAGVIEQGSVCLPFSRLSSLVAVLGVESVEVSVSEKHLASVSAGGSWTIHGIAGSEFPDMKVGSARGFSIAQNTLAQMIRQTVYATSDDSTRFVIQGVYLTLGEGMKAVATDGKRMSVATFDDYKGEEMSAILPTRAALELSKLLEGEKPAAVGIGESFITFNLGHTQILSKRIEGQFPNFHQVIPQDFTIETDVDREQLIETLRRTTIFCDEATDFKRIDLRLRKNTLEIEGGGKSGSGVESIAVRHDGKPIEMVFNAIYMIEVLGSLTCDNVRLHFIDALSPMKISAPQFLGIVMPLRAK